MPAGSESSGFPPVPNQPTPKPGHSNEIVATSAHRVDRTVTIQTPAVPPGTRYGRGASGCVCRSRTRAGKMPR